MGGILSGISGYFSRHLILGTFLPVVVFVTFSWILVVPWLPTNWPILKPIESLDPQWKILAFSFLTIVLTGLLYNINIPLIRLYEGYPWQELWIGRLRTKKYKRLFTIAQARWNGMPHIERELRTANDPRLAAIKNLRAVAGSTLFSEFPGREDLVLPTRLGNVIRSFEYYSLRQYGMDAVTFWPRLVSAISKDYATAVDEAKTSFDFMLNCSALSTLLTFMVFLSGLLYPSRFNVTGAWLLWLSAIIMLCVVAHFLYLLSIGRARTWGNTVRTSFDLYRRDLLKQLGYTGVPESLEEERKLWSNIGERMIYGDHYPLPQIAFVSKKTFIDFKPNIATFEILRGMTRTKDAQLSTSSGDYLITITIHNTGDYNASELSVTDTLPDDLVYLCGSAELSNPDDSEHAPRVSGTNPYSFSLGKLNYDGELVLKYKAVPLQQPTRAANYENGTKSSLLLFDGGMLAYQQTTEDHYDDKNKTQAHDGAERSKI
jgi:uncharacterized repeat protein (TIGR01451 family)